MVGDKSFLRSELFQKRPEIFQIWNLSKRNISLLDKVELSPNDSNMDIVIEKMYKICRLRDSSHCGCKKEQSTDDFKPLRLIALAIIGAPPGDISSMPSMFVIMVLVAFQRSSR